MSAAHISEQVAAALVADGWRFDGAAYSKRIEGFAEAGTLSDGARIVRLDMGESGRWLTLRDGWGIALGDVDLRNYANAPREAIAAVLQGARP